MNAAGFPILSLITWLPLVGGVVIMSVLTIALDLKWATIVIAYGFVARVLTGPTLSPLGQLVTRVITPRLGVAVEMPFRPGPLVRAAPAHSVGVGARPMAAPMKMAPTVSPGLASATMEAGTFRAAR